MNTWPVAVKTRLVESSTCAGPEATENATGRPEPAVAESAQTLVMNWSPKGGQWMNWSAFATARSPVAAPSQTASATAPLTA